MKRVIAFTTRIMCQKVISLRYAGRPAAAVTFDLQYASYPAQHKIIKKFLNGLQILKTYFVSLRKNRGKEYSSKRLFSYVIATYHCFCLSSTKGKSGYVFKPNLAAVEYGCLIISRNALN